MNRPAGTLTFGLYWCLVFAMIASDSPAADSLSVLTAEESAHVTRSCFDQCLEPPSLQYDSVEAWQKRRSEIRAGVQRALGLDPWPEKVDLDVHFGKVLERDGYTVTRIYWQSFPDVYASGYLYLPTASVKGRRPAVLCPHGHWPNGAREDKVQARCILFAKLGYVVLTVDSSHSYDYPLGASPLTAMTWNNIRALDYLCSREDVDAARIGSTGASGGAQQTFYLMAIEDRLAAAAPVNMVTYFHRIISNNNSAHCWCNFVPGVVAAADTTEMVAAFAPKPAFYISVSGDWTAEFSQVEYPAIKGVYDLLGASDHIGQKRWEWEHDYNKPMREAVATWFNRWLKDDPSPVIEPDFPTEPPDSLLDLNIPPPRADIVWGSQASPVEWNRAVARYFRNHARPEPATRWSKSRATLLRRNLREFLNEPARPSKKVKSRDVETVKLGSIVADKIVYESEPGAQIPALALHWETGSSDESIILVAHSRGKSALFRDGAPTTWLREHLTWGDWVFAVDVRFRGELANEWPGPGALGGTWVDPSQNSLLTDADSDTNPGKETHPRLPGATWNSIIFGRPETVLAVRDLRAALDYLLAPPHQNRRITLVGEGALGMAALLTAAIDERVAEVHADVPCSYFASTGGGQGPEHSCLPIIPNLLRVADVPEIAALVAPRICVLGMNPNPIHFEILRQAYATHPGNPPPVFRELSVAPTDRVNSIH